MGPDALLQRLVQPAAGISLAMRRASSASAPELQWLPVAGLMGSRTGRFRWAGPVRGSRQSPVEKSTALTARRCAPRKSVTSDVYASDAGTTMHWTNESADRDLDAEANPGQKAADGVGGITATLRTPFARTFRECARYQCRWG